MFPPEPMAPDAAERKLATVLFADLVGSTERASVEDPERTRALLERFYDEMAAELVDAGGTVEKFAGDAVMAVFGVPVALEDHVERALHASLAMQRRLARVFGDELRLRIGVNTGEVLAGRPREQSSFVSGDAVNVAARLEQAAAPGEILVGERAAALAAGAFEFGERRVARAKGKREGVECRRLVRRLSFMRPRGVPGLGRTFVGRDHELDLLREIFSHLCEHGERRLVTILGDPGVGKTRLVRELWEWIGAQPAPVVRRTGRCLSYGVASTYGPIGTILREHFAIVESDSIERVLGLLEGREILGLALGLDVAGGLDPREARDRLHDSWVDFVAELASETPLVVLVEDLHWAEAPLLELLERTVLEVDAPLLLLATARPEFLELSPTWGRGRVASEWIWLEPLSDEDVHRLVSTALAADVPSEAGELIARAEGNPLFVEELLVTLIERGVLDAFGHWAAGRIPTEAPIPDSVHAVLAARIDLLPQPAKAALQAASVVGRAFWPTAVRELLPGLEPDFGLLERRDFVRRSLHSSLEGEREFVFKHALTREVAYGSLTRRDRARLHGAFAVWLEERGGGRDEDAAGLALHYAEAVRAETSDLAWSDEPRRYELLRANAVRWLRRAAELAAGRYEVGDALELLDRALTLEADRAGKIEILLQAGRVHSLRFDVQGVRASLEKALDLEPEPDVAARIQARLAYYALGRSYMWKEAPPREVAERWLANALTLSRPGTEARAVALLAQALSRPGDGPEAADEALAIAESLGDRDLVAAGFEAKALAATAAREFAEACSWADRALEHSGSPLTRENQLFVAGIVRLRAGRCTDVRSLVEEHARSAQLFGPHEQMHALAHLVALESVLGRWEALAALAGRAEAAAAANSEFPCQFNWRALVVCTVGLAHLGLDDEVDRLVDAARAGAAVAGPMEREPALLRLALHRGDLEQAGRILDVLPRELDPWGFDVDAARLDALVALGRTQDIEIEAAPLLDLEGYSRPFALRALGFVRRDASLVERATAAFEEMGLEWRAAETRALAAALG